MDFFDDSYDDDPFDDEMEEINPLVHRFEDMLERKEEWFFDVEEFETLTDYYFENGKISTALKATEIASQQHPSSTTFIVRMAHYHTANNNLKRAMETLKKLEAIEPDSFDLHMTRATIYSKSGRHQRALHFYKAALRHADFPEDVWPFIAIEHQIMGNFEMALKYLKLTLDSNPEDEIAIYNIALCFDLLEKGEEGIQFFKKFTDRNPYCEVAWYHLAILSAKERQNDEALRAVDFAILIDEYFTAAYYEKARILERTFRYKEAAETYKESFEYEGPTGFSYYKIGLCYINMDKADKAESYLTKAIQEDPDLDEAYYELSLLKDEQNSGTEAIYFIEKALELDPENTDYLFSSAEIHRRAGLLNEAEVIYQSIIEKGYLDPEVFIDYAELLFDLCEFDDGMEVLYQGVQLNPDSADMNYRICGYLYTMEESDEADIYFKRALEINPERRVFFFDLFPKLKESKSIKKILKDKGM